MDAATTTTQMELTTSRTLPVSAREFAVLTELCPSGLALVEGPSPLEARVLWSNGSLDELVGEPAVGRSVTELAAFVSDEVRLALVDAARWGDGAVELPSGGNVTARFRRVPGDRWALLTSSSTGADAIAEDALRSSEERFRALAANAPIGVCFSEVGLRLGYVNDRFVELWGKPAATVLGMGWLDSVEPEDVTGLVDALSGVLTGESFDLVIRVRRESDQELRWIRTRGAPVTLPGQGAGFVGSFEDITEARRNEEQLAHQATHDPLTGLPNRAPLWERLDEVLGSSSTHTALLFFDLDDFKLVNDTLGHQAGDVLLQVVADRLRNGVRPSDMVVRLGGDEFVVLCSVKDPAEATQIAERLQDAVRAPLDLEGTEIAVTASVGVVVARDDHNAQDLLRDADVAMYQAKQAGKSRFAMFDVRVRSALDDRRALTVDLRHALADDALDVVYQPIWDVSADRPVPVGFEALVRWTHPERGPIPPDQIISLAEEQDLIDAVGRLVLKRACHDLAACRRASGLPGLQVSVNLSAYQLQQPNLVLQVSEALAAAGLEGSDLCLELTETVVMEDIEGAVLTLDRLRDLGVSLAVDDFGTGYSSLAYLHRLPVQAVKIDRSFVGRLEHSTGDAAIVAAIVGMAAALELTPVAEGVERPEQLDRLRNLGCTRAQGYLLSRPVPIDALPTALQPR
jgi:diguanylate cyclase (GGDEF)-like protein/PAS domain S-box-containing protein